MIDLRFDYNAICELESIGFGITDLPVKGTEQPMSTIRAMLYAGGGFASLTDAGVWLGEAVKEHTFDAIRDHVLKQWEADLPLLVGATEDEPKPRKRKAA